MGPVMSSATSSRVAAEPTPVATRVRRPGWRDPRIALGVAIMAVSVIAGAWLGRPGDDTRPVLVAVRDLPVGATVTGADVRTRRVHLAEELADRYLTGTLPASATLDRPVRAGELVPRSALADPASADRVEVPLSVATDDLPATVSRGSVVDVWVVPDVEHGADAGGRARIVLPGVTVLRLADRADSLAPRATRQVIVSVPADDDRLAAALGRTTSGRLVLVRRG
jgi:Flp pilus assembly protein CpaB